MQAPPTRAPDRSRNGSARRPLLMVAGVALLAVLAAGGYGLWYLFLQPPGPAAVADTSLPPVPTSAAAGSPRPVASGGIDGGETRRRAPC